MQIKYKKMFKKYTKNFSYLCVVIFFISCSSLTPYKVPVLQGNLFEEKDIDKLTAGLTKEQVQFILGTALIKDPFHSQRWDYYYSVKVGAEILSERKISIFFDENNLVDSWTIEEIDITD
tara:strand:+ start:252 stop:611 length:360 start_codon:yes stop_codon:yes gene_type:complete